MTNKRIIALAMTVFFCASPAYALPADFPVPTVCEAKSANKNDIDYLLLVNKTNKLPDDYEARVDLITVKNCFGKEFQVERETYAHFVKLREDMLRQGHQFELESTYRSVARQKELMEELRLSKGEDYVKNYVAVPGYSEHHTGLALDITLVEDNKLVDDVYGETETPYQLMHRRLADHGFILRYPPGKKAVTDYAYESWHCRYVGKDAAQKIYRQNLTLEEYLSDPAAMSMEGSRSSAEYWLKRRKTKKQNATIIREAFGFLGQACDQGEFADKNGGEIFVAKLWQNVGRKLPSSEGEKNKSVSLHRLNREDKLTFLKKLPPGSALFTENHAMLYLGMDESNTPYVIHASHSRWFPMEGDSPAGENTAPLKYYTQRIVVDDLFFYDTPTKQAIDNLTRVCPMK